MMPVHTDEPAVTDEGCGYAGEGKEMFCLAFVAAVEPTAAGEPGHGPLSALWQTGFRSRCAARVIIWTEVRVRSRHERTGPLVVTRLRHQHDQGSPLPDQLSSISVPGTVNFDAPSDDHKGDWQSSPLIPRMKRRIGLPEGGSGWGFPS